MLASCTSLNTHRDRETLEVFIFALKKKTFQIWGHRFRWVGLENGYVWLFWLFHYDVSTATKGQNFGSKFGYILGWKMKL